MKHSTLNRFVSWNPLPFILSFFQTEIREEILNGVGVRLLYLNGELINLNDQQCVADVSLDGTSIANASKQFSFNENDSTKKGNKKQITSIALFLPLTEFVYTKYSLPAVDSVNIEAALAFQREELLPASSDDLQLTLKHIKNADNFSLWFSEQKIQEYYLAFQQVGLSLTVILPRFSLFLNKETKQNVFFEQADNYIAQYHFSENSLTQIGHITKQDIAVEQFKLQWEKQFGSLDTGQLDNDSANGFKNKEDWFSWLKDKSMVENFKDSYYLFFPQKIKKNFKNRGSLRNSRVIGLVAFILLFALSIPFIVNEVRYWKYVSKYQILVESAKDVMDLRAKVLAHEEAWELYLKYPQVDAYDIIARLNKIIPLDSWISNFKIKNGYIEIDGFSPNPTAILEVISAQNDFNEVAFNKNTRTQRGQNKERFGITFHIKNIDVEAYEKTYFENDSF